MSVNRTDRVDGAVDVPRRVARGAGLVSLLLVGAAAYAQNPEPTAADLAMDNLRVRAPGGPQDEQILNDWIAQELGRLASGSYTPAEFRARLKAQRTDENNDKADKFVTALAGQVGQAFGAKLRDCDKLDPVAARTLAWALRDFRQPAMWRGLEAGLGCAKYADVRYLCAQAFVGLKDEIEADPLLREQVLAALRNAGRAETSGLVAQQIYQAMDFDEDDAQFANATAAIIDVLKARLDRRKALKGGPICDGGELPMLGLFQDRRPPNERLTRELVAQLAVLLRLDVQRMIQPDIDEFERINLVQSIDSGETLLALLVSPPIPAPDVRGALRKGDEVRPVELQLELINWIGVEGTPGVLNGAPWNVPIGAP